MVSVSCAEVSFFALPGNVLVGVRWPDIVSKFAMKCAKLRRWVVCLIEAYAACYSCHAQEDHLGSPLFLSSLCFCGVRAVLRKARMLLHA